MRFARFQTGDEIMIGYLDDDGQSVQPVATDRPADAETGVAALINRDFWQHGDPVPLASVRLLAPIPRPRRNIFCVGKNYFEHAHEFSSSGFDSSAAAGIVPEHPIVFSKLPDSVIGPDDVIEIDPSVSAAIDYEAELAVIIGKPGRNIAKDNALDHVWGFTIINDVTARDLQGQHSQWLIGKSQDTFGPMGPWVVSRDRFNLNSARIRCWVNNRLRQESNTGLLIFDVPAIIAAISNGITLQPGDVIATGTPAGVGIGFKPPRYLNEGDRIVIEIDGIGRLENLVAGR